MNQERNLRHRQKCLGILFLSFVLFLIEPKPGFARQKKQDNKKRRLEKSGTYTARNVIQEQNESGEQVYNGVKDLTMLNGLRQGRT